MKFLLVILFISCFQEGFAQANSYPELEYDSIVAYDFEWRAKSEFFSIIDSSGQLASTVKKSKRLDFKSSKKLTELIVKKSSYGQATAACFEPHLGFVYYKSGVPVAHITICIDCNRLESSIPIPEQRQGKQTQDDFVYYTADGMSSSLRKYLNSLLLNFKFSHQIIPGSIFD